MEKLAFWVFVGILMYGAATNSDKAIATINKITEKTEVTSSSAPYAAEVHKCRSCGTTRCIKQQQDYDEAVRRVDEEMKFLPARLVLPGGETVQERIDSIRDGTSRPDK